MKSRVYKIVPRNLWIQARSAGVFAGSADDLRDGFIHFSTRAQLVGTLGRHFADAADLLLLELDAEGLGDALKWEASRGGDLFPHLYRAFRPDEVVQVWTLGPPGDAASRIPEELN